MTPSMEPAESSGASTLPGERAGDGVLLVRTALSELTRNVSLSMDYLISVTDLQVFVLDRIFALGHTDLFGGPDLGQTATE